ncbi:hypothetical protein D9757_013235 [Collybiopsis confluens]|uniref:Nephrocystin 3-like N-terminal domain-containing protein n=1 Tax=Collybiopsis confluens TaxID=2823264 RepID=A0A8H5D3G0_9AGAR|nr:hypothetical protein D9757_013235 [Collybiopsis confluens]
MRKAYKTGKTKAKNLLQGLRSRSATPDISRPSTPDIPETRNAEQAPPAVTSGAVNTALDTLETMLGVLKEVSVVFPPLQAVVGGVVECFNIYKRVSGNTEGLKILVKDLIQRTNSLQVLLNQEDFNPSGMQDIKDLAEELRKIYGEVKQQSESGNIKKITQQNQRSDNFESFKQRIKGAYEKCQTHILSAIRQDIGNLLNENILAKLGHSPQAFYDTDVALKYGRTPCLEGTRTRIREDIQSWASNPKESTGYWIWGMAGTGKSTIAVSACQELKSSDNCTLAASFFCSRHIAECSNYRKIIPTLAYQLARTFRRFAVALGNIYNIDPDIAFKKPEEQVLNLLVKPWQAVVVALQEGMKLPVVVLDALDECPEIQKVLGPLIAAIQNGAVPHLKFLFTSRPEHPIQLLMQSKSDLQIPVKSLSRVQEFILHNVDEAEVQKDIYIYVRNELQSVAGSDEQMWTLTKLAGKLFIYAATAVKFVKGVKGIAFQQQRLVDSLENNKQPEDLKELYSWVVKTAIPSNLQRNESKQMWNILHTIVSLYQPMTYQGVAQLMKSNGDTVKTFVEQLQAVCFISNQNQCIYVFHLSFPEYIASEKSNECTIHIGTACFVEMEALRFNICDLPSSFLADAEVQGMENRIKENIPEGLGYSCKFWVDHMIKIERVEDLESKVETLLKTRGIYWIEAMSLLKALPRCGELMEVLLMKFSTNENITTIINSLQKLLFGFATSDVKDRTPHLYLSIIPFWYTKEIMQYGMEVKELWKVNQRRIFEQGQLGSFNAGSEVMAVALSQISSKIVGGMRNGTVKIWDARTGTQIARESLQGHNESVQSVAFSPDGTRIVSGSGDQTIRIWDATTGTQIGESLEGHDESVQSVAFSPDGTRIVSGSGDQTIRIWDATTGTQIGESLEGHDGWVQSVAFSPDGTRIVSGSGDQTIRIWDATTGTQIGESLEGHDGWVQSVAFSPDGTRIVSGSGDQTIRIWDATTGTQIGESLEGHDESVQSVAFSPDGTRIVSGSGDQTIRIWDATTGTQIGESLEGHDGWVQSVAFSPDGTRIVSGSDDQTIRIWDATTGNQIGESLKGHDAWVQSVTFSPDGTRIVSGSGDQTIRIWDATTSDVTAPARLKNPGHGSDSPGQGPPKS